MLNKTDKPPARSVRKKKKKKIIINNRNERDYVTTDSMDLKMIIKKYKNNFRPIILAT